MLELEPLSLRKLLLPPYELLARPTKSPKYASMTQATDVEKMIFFEKCRLLLK
jgi:hypothetical protein